MGRLRIASLLAVGLLTASTAACSQAPVAGRSPAHAAGPSAANLRNQHEPTDNAAEQGDNEDFTASSCGVERWAIKTGTDAGAKKINITTPKATSLATLVAVKPPSPIPPNTRSAPTETTDWQISVTLVEYKLESDSDYHLVLKNSAGKTMIAEIPSPSCVGSASPFKADITAARKAFDAKYHVTTSWQTANVPVVITGTGFFDYKHGQTGVAPNAIEIHPVLGITFAKAAVPALALSVAPPALSVVQGSSGSVTVGSARSGLAGPPGALQMQGLPAGVTATLARGTWVAGWPASSAALPAQLYATTVTFHAGGTATPGDFAVRVRSGGLWTQVELTVVEAGVADFYLAALPATFTVPQGGSVTIPVVVRPLAGFHSPVYLVVNGLAPGLRAVISPAVVAPGGSSLVLRLTAGAAAPLGTHAVTLGAVGANQSHDLLLSITTTP